MNWIRATAQARTHGEQAASQAGSLRMFRISPIDSPLRSSSVLISQVAEQSRKFPTIAFLVASTMAVSGCSQSPEQAGKVASLEKRLSDSEAEISILRAHLDVIEGRIDRMEHTQAMQKALRER